MERFWMPLPIYKEVSIGFEPQVSYWTVGGNFAFTFQPAGLNLYFPYLPFYENKGHESKSYNSLSGLRLSFAEATELADLFEKEKLSALSMKRPAYYQRLLNIFLWGIRPAL